MPKKEQKIAKFSLKSSERKPVVDFVSCEFIGATF